MPTAQASAVTIAASTNSEWLPSQSHSGELSKLATRLKDEGDFDGAINALRESFAINRPLIENRCRVAVFMQHAGRSQDAVAEFHAIVTEVRGHIDEDFAHQPERVRIGLRGHTYAAIADKARVVFQRSGWKSEASTLGVIAGEMRTFAIALQQDIDRACNPHEIEAAPWVCCDSIASATTIEHGLLERLTLALDSGSVEFAGVSPTTRSE